MSSTCESLVKVKIFVGGKEKTTKDMKPCGEPGVRYRVRRPYIAGPISPGDPATVMKAPSAEIEQVLCKRHKWKAIEEGMECIQVPEK